MPSIIGLFIILIFAGIIIRSIGRHKKNRNTEPSYLSEEQGQKEIKETFGIGEKHEYAETPVQSPANEQKPQDSQNEPDESTIRKNPVKQADPVVQSSSSSSSSITTPPNPAKQSSTATYPIIVARPSVAARPSIQRDVLRIVLLTDSGKFGGACVSGYNPQTKKLVRFVSDAATGKEIAFSELRGISPMDIVAAERVQDCPLGPQSENILIKPRSIRRVGRYDGTIEDIRKNLQYADSHMLSDTTSNRLSDITGINHSLEIISVQDLVLREAIRYDGGKTTRADFRYKGKYYSDYRVTDFYYDLRKREDKIIRIPSADLILSIPAKAYIVNGESKGFYKFIAAIYPTASQMPEPTSSHREKDDTVELFKDYETGMPMRLMEEKYGRTDSEILSIIENFKKTKHRN